MGVNTLNRSHIVHLIYIKKRFSCQDDVIDCMVGYNRGLIKSTWFYCHQNICDKKMQQYKLKS